MAFQIAFSGALHLSSYILIKRTGFYWISADYDIAKKSKEVSKNIWGLGYQ